MVRSSSTIAVCAMLTLAPASLAAQSGLPRALILTLAPQDGAVFASWSPLPEAEYRLKWRAPGASAWTAVDAGAATAKSVAGLDNGVRYDFQIEASVDGATIVSGVVPATPRARPLCSAIDYYPWLPPVSFFCTKATLDAYLTQRGIDPLSLRCRQRLVTEWNEDAPDCTYATPDGEHLLLLRAADSQFAGTTQRPHPSDVRRFARQAIWSAGHPFDGPAPSAWVALQQPFLGTVSRHAQAYSYLIADPRGLRSRITLFTPAVPISGRFAIYHEGHGGAAVDIGSQTIDWLLDRGWHVVAVDMPLLGLNMADAQPGLQAHGQLDALDDGSTSPIAQFISPLQSIVDWILQLNVFTDPEILLIGRSGGGWASYVYGAVDPRIDFVVSVAGGRPISERLDAPWGAAELGDYEQTAAHLYTVVGHEHLMLAAGSKGALYLFNHWDPCCFQIEPQSAFVDYLRAASSAFGKPVEVFVDEQNSAHSIGPQGYLELERFLTAALTRVRRVPSPPTGMRIVR